MNGVLFFKPANDRFSFTRATAVLLPAVLLLALVAAGGSCRQSVRQKPATNELKRGITDDLGRTVELPLKVRRAVSLAPNLTEIVFAVGAGDRLVGATSYCNYPAAAKNIRRVSDTLNPNIESIIAVRPQVVLISTASQLETFTKTLEAQEIGVFVTNPDSLESIYRSIKKIGEIFGVKGRAVELVGELEERVERVRLRNMNEEKPRVFVQIDKNALYTIGKDSYLTDLIELAGGISVTEGVATAYPKISKETALALRPEVIILSASPDNTEPNEVFADSPAVKNGRVYRIDADILSRPGPRVVEALEQIAGYLHPAEKNR